MFLYPYGEVIAHPVMQAYDNLALEDNLEIGQAVLGKVLTSAPVPSSSQPKKHTHSLRKDLVSSSTCEGGGCRFNSRKDQLQKGLKWSVDASLSFFSPTLLS